MTIVFNHHITHVYALHYSKDNEFIHFFRDLFMHRFLLVKDMFNY